MKGMKNAFWKAKWAVIGGLLAVATPAFADNSGGSITLTNPLSTNSFSTVVSNVIGFLFWDVATPLCTLMALVGGFQLMTSAGNPEKASQGRKTLMYAAIGFGVVLMASTISQLIQSILNNT